MISDNDYQWLFRKAPVMASSISAEGLYVDVNDTLLRRLGYERMEMVDREPESFATPESAVRLNEELRPALRRTGKLDNKPFSFITKKGDVVDCHVNAIIEYDQSGEALRTIAMYSEIADEVRANLKYRTLYRSTPAMLHTVDGGGLVVTVTDHWLHKLGYKRDEVVGRPITDFFSARDQKKYMGGRLHEIIRQGEFNNIERQMQTKKGPVSRSCHVCYFTSRRIRKR